VIGYTVADPRVVVALGRLGITVTVEKAAMEGVRGINPKLKQLLVAAIHAG
jgi:hypothetical protein